MAATGLARRRLRPRALAHFDPRAATSSQLPGDPPETTQNESSAYADPIRALPDALLGEAPADEARQSGFCR